MDTEAGTDHGRRTVLKQLAVGGAVVWVAPIVTSEFTPAAATSSALITGVEFHQMGNNSTPDCFNGLSSGPTKATMSIQRLENPARLQFTITITVGTPLATRTIRIFESDSSSCFTGPESFGSYCVQGSLGCATWAEVDPDGNKVSILMTHPIQNATATRFVIWLTANGGGGQDDWITGPLTLS